MCRLKRKLFLDNSRFELVIYMLCNRLSSEQISGKLQRMIMPRFDDAYVCRETIDSAICALPFGELQT
ncbi:MAG: hypothetical protein CME80_02205 [Halomonas sp.]|nr:hypothetical protein [Halomonas sp.]